MVAPILLQDLAVPTDRTAMDRDFFNTRFTKIVNAFTTIQNSMDLINGSGANLIQLGLDRLNLSLGTLLTQLEQAASQGFLIAQSVSSNLLVVGNIGAWNITQENGRDFFQPTPFIVAMDN